MMSNVTGITGNLCNKCPKWLVEQISDYCNAISGSTLNSRAPGGPVTINRYLLNNMCRDLLNDSQ